MLSKKMVGQAASTLCLILTMSFVLKGDLKYLESTQITGGMMEGMTKMLGLFGAKGLTNTLSTNYIKGDRMRHDSFTNNELTHSEIVRLDREDVVSIDHKRKSYSVMTFEQIHQQMVKTMQSMKNPDKNADNNARKNSSNPDMKFEPKISIKDSGETRVINGYNTKHMIVSVQLEGQDQKTNDKGSFGVDSDLWITKDIQGFEEQKDFYKKYLLKMGTMFIPMGAGAGTSPTAQDPRVGQALEELRKQSEKMEGVPVLTIASVNISGTSTGGSQSTQASSSSQETSSSTDSQEAVGKSLGKVLGGFGGFGHKKKKDEEPKPTSPAQSPTSSSTAGSASINLMKTTTELKSVSNAALDAGLFEVPQGYQLTQK